MAVGDMWRKSTCGVQIAHGFWWRPARVIAAIVSASVCHHWLTPPLSLCGRYGLHFVVAPITRDNYIDVLSEGGPAPIARGDFLVNLSVNVSSVRELRDLRRSRADRYLLSLVMAT
jgi:hypothetical protein